MFAGAIHPAPARITRTSAPFTTWASKTAASSSLWNFSTARPSHCICRGVRSAGPDVSRDHLGHFRKICVSRRFFAVRGQLPAARAAWHGTTEVAAVRNRTDGRFEERHNSSPNSADRSIRRKPVHLRLRLPEHPPQPLSHPVAITHRLLGARGICSRPAYGLSWQQELDRGSQQSA